MKILSIRIKNLSSLKGEHFIDFTSPELATAGIIAITGPTGAGKSTILDAISLALYSYAPRIGDITQKVIGDKGVIVTKNTKDAFAHLEFEVNNIQYKAEWGIYVTNRGNWSEISHKLSQKNDGQYKAISEKKSDTKGKITDLIGLDKNQFTKAIILSQGKFDEFLQADIPERYKLLEIITGTEKFREIGKKVYQICKDFEDQKEKIDIKIEGVKILEEAEVHQIETNIDNLNQKIKANEQIKTKFENILTVKESIVQLRNLEQQLNQQQTELDARILNFQDQEDKLKNHDLALPLQVDLNNWSRSSKEIGKCVEKIRELHETITENTGKKNYVLEDLANKTNQLVKDENFSIILEDYFTRVNLIDTEINGNETSLQVQTAPLTALYEHIPTAAKNEIEGFKKDIVQLNLYLDNIEGLINQIILPDDLDQNNIEQYKNTLETKIGALVDAIGKKTTIDTETVEILKFQQKVQDSNGILSIATSICSQKNIELVGLSEELEQLQLKFDHEKSTMDLEQYRSLLIDDQPCPCCGSIDHPYVQNQPVSNNQTVIDLKNKQAQIEKINNEIKDLEVTILSENKNVENYKSNIQSKEGLIEATKQLLNRLRLELGLFNDVTVQELDALKASYTNIKNDLDKYRTLKDAKESIKSFLDVLKVYLQTKANLENKKEERIRFQPQTSILDYKTSLARNWELANSIIENANIEILDFEAQLATSENNFDTLNKKLLSKIQELGFASIEDLSSLLLNDDDAAQIRRQSKEIEDLKTELNINKGNNQTSLQAAISNDDASITIEETKEKLNALVEDNRNHLQQVGEFKGVIKLNQENKKRVEVLLDDLKKVKEQCYYYDILDELVGDQTGNKFNKLIQRITLRKLFVMTNEKLMNLMDRYQLALGGEGLEDEIWVIDTYMGDEKRSISSVSGGERFVISLAMALSLSDLASNNVRIDSLFIDEGFGSLSPDELDNAVSMLENLQAANDKTIGIISHVESLKERISTQIQVKKLHNGESTLNLKVNDKITSLTI